MQTYLLQKVNYQTNNFISHFYSQVTPEAKIITVIK